MGLCSISAMKILLYTLMCLQVTLAYPETGNWTLKFTSSKAMHIISNSMFDGTMVKIDLASTCADTKKQYTVEWLMFDMVCYGATLDDHMTDLDCYNDAQQQLDPTCACQCRTCTSAQWKNGTGEIDCADNTYNSSTTNVEVYKHDDVCKPDPTTEAPKKQADASNEDDHHTQRKRRNAGEPNDSEDSHDGKNSTTAPTTTTAATTTTPTTTTTSEAPSSEETICTSWTDGPFSVYIVIKEKATDDTSVQKRAAATTPVKQTEKPKPLYVTIVTRDAKGHLLSAIDLPKLYFYLTMTIIYVLYGFMWLVMMACHWRDLLRIQYFIGLVIILGFIEKVFFYSEYEHVDKFGETSKFMVIIAELVSVAKKTLARALVIVVSVGFGIIKPRLGPTLHKLLAVCFIYFILASVESCLHAMQSLTETVAKLTSDSKISNQTDLLAIIPLSLCETGILYWVFSSLLQTIRTLRLRRNVAKLSLYRHFTNLLIFSLLVSIGFLVWYFLKLRFSDCIEDLREIWLGDCFWAMLFSIILFVIMILWRPSMNNQRYSHSLLVNEDGEDEEDTLMGTEAFEAKKRPQMNGKASARDKRRSREEKVEDDLQWIEDNIPASVADSALQPVLNDSEEEIMTTRFELSKMD